MQFLTNSAILYKCIEGEFSYIYKYAFDQM